LKYSLETKRYEPHRNGVAMSQCVQTFYKRFVHTLYGVAQVRLLAQAERTIDHLIHTDNAWATTSLEGQFLRVSERLISCPSQEPNSPPGVFNDAAEADQEMEVVVPTLALKASVQSCESGMGSGL